MLLVGHQKGYILLNLFHYSTFLHNIKLFGYKIGIQFNKSVLVVENNYATTIVHVYIVYDLDNWSRNTLNNFILKNRLFAATIIVKSSDKNKYYVYSGYGKAFDGAGLSSFGNDVARDVVIFGLVTTTILNTKIGEVKNKIIDYAKYVTTPEFNKFAGPIFDTKLKQANLATNSDLNTVC